MAVEKIGRRAACGPGRNGTLRIERLDRQVVQLLTVAHPLMPEIDDDPGDGLGQRVGALTAEPPSVLVAEGRVARQRQQVALLEARGKDATEARSVLSAMVYSLRVLRRQQRRDRELPRN